MQLRPPPVALQVRRDVSDVSQCTSEERRGRQNATACLTAQNCLRPAQGGRKGCGRSCCSTVWIFSGASCSWQAACCCQEECTQVELVDWFEVPGSQPECFALHMPLKGYWEAAARHVRHQSISDLECAPWHVCCRWTSCVRCRRCRVQFLLLSFEGRKFVSWA